MESEKSVNCAIDNKNAPQSAILPNLDTLFTVGHINILECLVYVIHHLTRAASFLEPV
jgi:hypothetical protein